MSIDRVESYKGFENAFGFLNEGSLAENSLSAYGDEYISSRGGNSSIDRRGPSVFRSGVVIATTADTPQPEEPEESKPSEEPEEPPGGGCSCTKCTIEVQAGLPDSHIKVTGEIEPDKKKTDE